PEQLDGHRVDARADLYSLGSILYEHLTGRVPFDSDSVASLVAAVLHESPPQTLNPGVDPFLASLALTLLAKDPAQRFQTAEEVAEALQRGRVQAPAALPAKLEADAPAAAGPLYRAKLAGREQEVKLICDAVAASRQGRGSLVLVEGEA